MSRVALLAVPVALVLLGACGRAASHDSPADPAPESAQRVAIKPSFAMLRVGATVRLVATAVTAKGAATLGPDATWSSSNEAIASVSNTGVVTAHTPGRVLITAMTGDAMGTATVEVLTP